MPDLETRMPELLRELSTEAPTGDGGRSSVLRRARRRRALTAASAALTVVAVIAGGVVGVRALAPPNRATLGNPMESPTPHVAPTSGSAIGAVWPETTAEGLAFAQQQVDDGHQPWRTDPAMTAEAFAVNVFGWDPGRVRSSVSIVPGDTESLVSVSSRTALSPIEDALTTGVTVQPLGRMSDEGGVLSVTAADLPAIDTTSKVVDGMVAFDITTRSLPSATRMTFAVYDGTVDSTPVTHGAWDGAPYDFSVPAETTTGTLIAVVALEGRDGSILGADVLPILGLPNGSSTSVTSSPNVKTSLMPAIQAPRPVVRTRDAIWMAVSARDFEAMRGMMDPNTFSYNFDDGSDPIPAWKDDPSVLDPILTMLQLQPTEPKKIEGYGTFYIWPYLVDSNFKHLSASEIDDLHTLGFDDAAIEDMRTFGSYLGPRLAIDETGLWRNYTTGGD
jgi:hypothetical protein